MYDSLVITLYIYIYIYSNKCIHKCVVIISEPFLQYFVAISKKDEIKQILYFYWNKSPIY